jgi:ABC-type multidrug transport system ATPase subunit
MKHYTRLTGRKSDQANLDTIDSILSSLGLSQQKDTIVGDIFLKGLSGGQKRRLSIALEALSNPKNFFLDEPTSGLDSESAYQVMKFLREYAAAAPGRRVILTIHQPSSFIWQTIDHVVLMAKGKLMFQGNRKDMESFFESAGYPTPPEYNPADHYVNAVNDEFSNNLMHPDEWSNEFLNWHFTHGGGKAVHGQKKEQLRRSSIVHKDEVHTNRANALTTSIELTRRYFANLIFNPGILGTRIAMYAMLSLMCGALFWDLGSLETYASIQSRVALSFYCVAFFIFMSIAVMPFTVAEKGIVDKEVRNGYYHPANYHLAQAISSLPGAAILAFIVTLLVITMTGLRGPFWYFVIMFLSLVNAEALAQLVSHMVRRAETTLSGSFTYYYTVPFPCIVQYLLEKLTMTCVIYYLFFPLCYCCNYPSNRFL